MTKTTEIKNGIIITFLLSLGSYAYAVDTPITGTVQPKCSIFTDVQGVYGTPDPSTLSTAAADGGVQPVIRFDVASAGYYTARISYPNTFSSSPTLTDSVTWTGSVTVSATSDAGMAGYEAAKVTYENVTEYDMTVAGTTWFTVSSQADYGVDKSFPAGQYTAIASAECIAQ